MASSVWWFNVLVVIFSFFLSLVSLQLSVVSETLDAYICLRANGFFPHDIRCDHFYECRNNTIINEGICKQGLRFDYRYRKKPRCIHADLIDCRITQVEFLNTDTNFMSTFPTTPAPPPTTSREFRTTFGRTGSTAPPSTIANRQSITQFPATVMTTITTTTEQPFTTIAPSTVVTRARNTPTIGTTTTGAQSRVRHTNHLDSDNVLTKKRKLTQKSLKLRRGHLQEDVDDQNILSRAISSATIPPPPFPLGRPKSIFCPHRSGYYADKEDCRKFYACDDGRAFPMSCPLGLAYDEMTGTCAWPDMVEGCRSEEMLRFTCPEPNENEILDFGDPRYPTSDCRKFVVCVVSELYGTRTPRLLGCEEGLVFNPQSRSCDYPENVPTCANYYDGVPLSRSIHGRLARKRRVRL